MKTKPMRWNDDKKHRCPGCHTIAMSSKPSSWAVYECCRCRALFTRWPRLSFLLPNRGIVCEEHRHRRWDF